MVELSLLDIPIDHKNKLLHKLMCDQVYDLINIFYELLSSKEHEIKKAYHDSNIYNNFAMILLNNIKRQTFTPWLSMLMYLCDSNDIILPILKDIDEAFEKSVISIGGLSLRHPTKGNSFIPKRNLKQLNDARDEGIRVFIYMSCIKNTHIYHNYPNHDCSGLQLILSLLDNKDDITALLSTRSLLVLLVSLTTINDDFQKNSISILETCISILCNLNIKFQQNVVALLDVKQEYDNETTTLNDIENEFKTELCILSDGRGEDDLDEPLSYYLENSSALTILYNKREESRERTIVLRLKYKKLGEIVIITLKRLRVLFLLITRVLSLVLECNRDDNIIMINTKDIYKIYTLLKEQDWTSIIAISRLEFRLFDVSTAELLFATLSLYFPYFQEIFLESIYNALYWLVDTSISWYDLFESKTYCTLATRLHVALCIWGCTDNKLVKERVLSWKSKANKPIILKLLYNNVKPDDVDNDDVNDNQDGKYDNAALINIMEEELHKGHLMVQHNHSMLSTCQERLHCACCEVFTSDLNELLSFIFASNQIGGSKVNETHPIEIINFLLSNPVDIVNPHNIVTDIHIYNDMIIKILDTKSSSKISAYQSAAATLSALMSSPLLREKFDMLTHLLRGGYPVLKNPSIAEPNHHLILTPPLTLSYISFVNSINSNNRVYSLLETAIKVIYMPSSVGLFIGNGFLGKSTYRCALSFVSSFAALGIKEREVVQDCMKKIYDDAHHLWSEEEESDNHGIDFLVPLILLMHGGIIDQVIRQRFPHSLDDDTYFLRLSKENSWIVLSILELLNTLLDMNENLKKELLATQGTFIAQTLLNALDDDSAANEITVLVIRLAIALSSNNEFRVYFGQKGLPSSVSFFTKSTVIVEKIFKFEPSSLSSDALIVLELARAKAYQYSKELLLMLNYDDMSSYYDNQRKKSCIDARNLSLICTIYINNVNDGCQLNVMLYPEIFKYLQSNLVRLSSLTELDVDGFHTGIARQACILLQKIAYRNVNGQALVIETGCIKGLIDCLNEVSGADYIGSQELRNSIIDCVEKLVTYSNPLLLEMIQKSCGVLGLLQLMYNGSSHIRIGIITALLEKCSKYPKFYDEIIKYDGIRMIYWVLEAKDFLVQANGLRLLKMLLIKRDARIASMAKANINVLGSLLNSSDLQVKRNAVEVLGILSSDDADQDEMHKILRNNGSSIVDKIRDISSDSFPLPRAKVLPTLDFEQFEREQLEMSSPNKRSHLFNSPNTNMFSYTKSSSVSVISDAEREFRSTNLTAANVLAQFSDVEETIWPDGNPDVYKNILKLGVFPKIE